MFGILEWPCGCCDSQHKAGWYHLLCGKHSCARKAGVTPVAVKPGSAQTQQPEVLDADGKPIRVGDRLCHYTDSDCLLTVGELIYPEHFRSCAGDGYDYTAKKWRHASPPQQPEGDKKDSGAKAEVSGPSSSAEDKYHEPAVAREAGIYLAAFDAAVTAHLVPRLPKRCRVVSDNCGPARGLIVVLDARGHELLDVHKRRVCWIGWFDTFDEAQADKLLQDIASALMAAELGQ